MLFFESLKMTKRSTFISGVVITLLLSWAHVVILSVYAFVSIPAVSVDSIVSNYCTGTGETYSDDQRAVLLQFAKAFLPGFARICIVNVLLQGTTICSVIFVFFTALRISNAHASPHGLNVGKKEER